MTGGVRLCSARKSWMRSNRRQDGGDFFLLLFEATVQHPFPTLLYNLKINFLARYSLLIELTKLIELLADGRLKYWSLPFLASGQRTVCLPIRSRSPLDSMGRLRYSFDMLFYQRLSISFLPDQFEISEVGLIWDDCNFRAPGQRGSYLPGRQPHR